MATPCRGAGAGAQGEGVDIPLQGHGVEPTPGVLRLSENAINLRVRRVLQPNCKGEFKVSESIRKMYTDKRGGGKDKLLQIFQSCGFDPETFVQECEVLAEDLVSNELRIEGEFVSEETMLNEWGWTQKRVDGVKSIAEKDPLSLMRKDRYEKDLVLYWAETAVKGNHVRTSTTGFKRKLKWEENGADLGSFARPTGLPNFGGVPSSSVKDKEIQGPVLSTLFVNKIFFLSPEDEDQSDHGSDVSIRDVKKEKALAIEKIARKKAGLPELELDALPSSICNKMMTCLSKRSQKLQDGIDKLDSAEKLSGLQEQTLVQLSGFLKYMKGHCLFVPCSANSCISPLRPQALPG
ncbi:unnamed protein product [Cladocopium goreaui]|uniref:Uncharacterized protein n=1 Tax=Cladocopium goreaui TaxID=2562237 RepID=A0A9P1FFG4_9DINO|nr:unnamed protein product [Cladocopium goreaui]